ncbi:MAG TPA: lysophospholipid acyltransferase family protein [Chloroflexota bacterium]
MEGLENIPPPPYLLASNHQRWFDPLFLIAAFPKRTLIYSMAKRETVFNRAWKRALVRRFGVFPISPDQGQLDTAAVATVYEILKRGGVVLIFPEGHYSKGRKLLPLKKGVAHFALQAAVPICPVAISGLDRLRLRSEVTISIGKPIYPIPPLRWRTSAAISRLVLRVRQGMLRAFGADEEARARHALLASLTQRLKGLLLGRHGPTPPGEVSPGASERPGR